MFVTFIAVIAGLLCLANAGSVNLTHVTLNQLIGAHKTLVVMYYAPWCSYSKEALPIWEELAESMSKNAQDSNILVAKVDCVAEPDAYWQEGIKSFPTIKAYVNHNTIPIVYDGERIANTMWRYFRLLNQQYVAEISTMQEFVNLQVTKLSSTKPLVLTLLAPEDSLSDDNVRNRKIDGACKKADRVTCVISRSPELAAALDLPVPSVTIYTAFENKPSSMKDDEVYHEQHSVDVPVTRRDLDDLSASDLSDWFTNLSYPPLTELSVETSELIFSQQRPGFQNHFLFLLHGLSSSTGQHRLDTVHTIGRSLQGKAVVIYVDMDNVSLYASEVLKSLQVDSSIKEDMLYGVVSKTSAMHFYTLKNELAEPGGVVKWMENVLGGLITPVRSTTHEQ